MKLTDESKAFYFATYSVVKQIPHRKVTSYGHIAYLIGRPENSRQVGYALKHFKEIVNQLNQDCRDSNRPQDIIEHDHISWWRVLSSSGKISPRGTNGQIEQMKWLQNEGVDVNNYMVDLETWGWFPDEIDY